MVSDTLWGCARHCHSAGVYYEQLCTRLHVYVKCVYKLIGWHIKVKLYVMKDIYN